MLRNSHKDQRKGDKLVKRVLGPYAVEEPGERCLPIEQPGTGKALKMCVSDCRLKEFHSRKV